MDWTLKVTESAILSKYAFRYYCEVVKEKGLAAVRPVEAVMNVFDEYSQSIGFDFNGFQSFAKQRDSRLAKLDDQIAERETEIAKFRGQKTKKARAKVRHLETVKAELGQERKKTSNVLNQFKVPAYSL